MVQLNLLPVGSAYLYMPHFYVALIAEGTNTTLKEKDVWRMSVTMRARPVFRKFMTIKTGGLWWRLWEANSQDMMCVSCIDDEW